MRSDVGKILAMTAEINALTPWPTMAARVSHSCILERGQISIKLNLYKMWDDNLFSHIILRETAYFGYLFTNHITSLIQ